MKMKDSSEIQEAAQLFNELVAKSAVVSGTFQKTLVKGPRFPSRRQTSILTAGTDKNLPVSPIEMAAGDSDKMYRGDRLENTLFAMCKRGGFQGSVLVDSDGLPVAVYNSPVEQELSAAFAMVLGEALGKAAKLLNQNDANNIALDINFTDKAVIRCFHINTSPFFLMIICSQEIDERAEVELSIEQITSILKKK